MIHFLLTPDSTSSLALKRRIAEQAGRLNVIVGTWPELLTHARRSHILPNETARWEDALAAGVEAMTSAYWADSLRNVPGETLAIVAIVGRHLAMLLDGLGSDRSFDSLSTERLPQRLARRINDFSELHRRMEIVLPPDLADIRSMLHAGPERRLRPVRVYHVDGWPRLTRWQQELIEALNDRAGAPDVSLLELLDEAVAVPAAPVASLLRHLQANIFSGSREKLSCDETVQWVGCRDLLQEVEISAGMVQQALADDPALTYADIALLLPSDDRYAEAVAECFQYAGIPLSTCGRDVLLRDLGMEAVYYLLLCNKGLAPAMALATVVTSPLMPWDTKTGHALAQKVIDGNFRPELTDDAEGVEKAMLALLMRRTGSPAELSSLLRKFVRCLRTFPVYDHPMNIHRRRAEDAVQRLLARLSCIGSLDDAAWHSLLRDCPPVTLKVGCPDAGLTREGVAVFREGQEPWRKVRHLFVLGCSEGHYPGQFNRSPVFLNEDLVALREQCGLQVDTGDDVSRRWRDVFRRQLCAASDSATFLVPRRDRMGKRVSPSPSLAFMASLVEGDSDDEKLVVDVETDQRSVLRGLAIAPNREADPRWQPVTEDLDLEIDLIEWKRSVQSPTRLETLMVSPLAWLLDSLGATHREWRPEQLDVMTRGTLAHRVFEMLFSADSPLPTADEVVSRVPGLLDQAVSETCPFLKGDDWNVEREHLKQEVAQAAKRWRDILETVDATIVGNEIRLQGTLQIGPHDELTVHGTADLLLELSDGRLLVVDYKNSSSKGRRLRMKSGYELQAPLYGAMLKTGGPAHPEKVKPEVAEKLAAYREAGEIRSMYYLMKDHQVLTDSSGWLPHDFPGQPEMGEGISREAMAVIRERIWSVRKGKVVLNRESDETHFKDHGVPLYVMDKSPLLKAYMQPQASLQAEEEEPLDG